MTTLRVEQLSFSVFKFLMDVSRKMLVAWMGARGGRKGNKKYTIHFLVAFFGFFFSFSRSEKPLILVCVRLVGRRASTKIFTI